MLTMTKNAVDAVDSIVASAPDSANAGLRISHSVGADGQPGFTLGLVERPEPSDQVVDVDVEGEHASVFLEPQAAEELDDKVLDATVREGQLGFVIGEQGAPPAS